MRHLRSRLRKRANTQSSHLYYFPLLKPFQILHVTNISIFNEYRSNQLMSKTQMLKIKVMQRASIDKIISAFQLSFRYIFNLSLHHAVSCKIAHLTISEKLVITQICTHLAKSSLIENSKTNYILNSSNIYFSATMQSKLFICSSSFPPNWKWSDPSGIILKKTSYVSCSVFEVDSRCYKLK